MSMQEIETLTQSYADTYRDLESVVQSLEDEVRAIKRSKMVKIRQLAAESAAHKEAVLSAVVASPGLFKKPRTRIIAGVKVGLQKRRGKVVIDDEEATIRRMRALLPIEQVELLVRVREDVYKQAVYDLSAGDLRRLGIKIADDTDEPLVKIAGEDIEALVDSMLTADVSESAGAGA